ncbi:MAG TPA: HAMP domain-containing sensor histidine kinase [Phycisphaerae bacterium]|nr:HAMP domain-containing sensor histidine kinase [Phycisphaerae bacterium]
MADVDPLPLVKRFAAGFAHELRTPLTVIRNAVYCLRHTIPPSDETTESLDMIDEEAHAINRVLTRLVEITHEFQLKRESCDLEAMSNTAIDQLDHERAIDWRLDFEPKPFVMECDCDRFGHVLFNLFKNASYAMRGSGKVVVRARRDAKSDRIEIHDSGGGVSEEAGDVFAPFTTTKPAGVGLGLTYCKKVVERHGGRIDMADTGPGGTTFRIEMPRESAG